MKKMLYIFRHGETDSNAQKRMQGWLDVPLNANGVAQAQALAKKLSGIKFDVVYSSSLSRALDTAHAVVGNNTKITTHDDLREWNMGDFCGHIVKLTDSPADTPIDMSNDVIYAPFALLSNDDYVPPNGESYNVFIARVRKAILDIVKKFGRQNNRHCNTYGGGEKYNQTIHRCKMATWRNAKCRIFQIGI